MSETPQKDNSANSSGVKKAILWIVVGALIAGAAILLFQPKGGGGFTKVDSAGLQAMQAKGAQIVDVRTSGEYALAHIPGSINVPVDQLQKTAASWNKDAVYVVYCASGQRSAQAQDIMKSMGFKTVADLTGGIATWTGATEKGTASTSPSGQVPTNGKPVFIEFYTPT
jgi:rhodanese-related sulfurtransferase